MASARWWPQSSSVEVAPVLSVALLQLSPLLATDSCRWLRCSSCPLSFPTPAMIGADRQTDSQTVRQVHVVDCSVNCGVWDENENEGKGKRKLESVCRKETAADVSDCGANGSEVM